MLHISKSKTQFGLLSPKNNVSLHLQLAKSENKEKRLVWIFKVLIGAVIF